MIRMASGYVSPRVHLPQLTFKLTVTVAVAAFVSKGFNQNGTKQAFHKKGYLYGEKKGHSHADLNPILYV